MALQAFPGAWSTEIGAAREQPLSPEIRGNEAYLPSVWVLVRAGGARQHGRRKSRAAAPQLPAPGQRVSRQSPRWRSGATANGEPHAPRSARPAPPARPPRRSAAPLRALARQSRLGAAASRAAPASLGPSASSGRLSLTPSLPPLWGLHEIFKKGIKIFFFVFCFFFSRQMFFDI